jgi:hypothetical protein
MQYTIRKVPKAVDKALRAKAKAEGKSLNQMAVQVLQDALGLGDAQKPRRDLGDLVGSMTEQDARTIDESVRWLDEADLRFQRAAMKRRQRKGAA